MPSERTHRLFEARMKDVRRFQQKEVSGAVVGRKFKEAFQALGAVATALMSAKQQNLASEVDDLAGMLRRVQKQVREGAEGAANLTENILKAQEAAERVMRKVRPGRDRKSTIKAIAKAVTKDPVLMDTFHEYASRSYSNGRVGYEYVADVLGSVIWQWKEEWEIGENDPRGGEFEELSRDGQLAMLITNAVKRYKPVGAKLGGINWTQVDHLYSGLGNRIRRHPDDDRSVKDALDWARRLVKALEAK